jgi:tetratricopeptide (TPR) repeat protein
VKRGAKQRLFRFSIAAGIFIVSWLLLVAIGSTLFDEQAVVKWLVGNEWLKFVSPKIREKVGQGWQPILSLILSILAYRSLKPFTNTLAGLLFRKAASPLSLSFGSTGFGLRQPEILLTLPGELHTCSLILKNGGPATKVNRVEVEASIFERIPSQTSQRGAAMQTLLEDMRTVVSPLHLESGGRSEIGLEWKKVSENLWSIDTPFALQEGKEVELPMIDPSFDESNEHTEFEVRQLVGLSTLEIQFKATVMAEQMTFNTSLSIPLRIFSPLEDEGDGGIDDLVNALDVNESEKVLLREIYQHVRQVGFELRTQIAENLNKSLEMQRLREFAEEIAPYDRNIELRPEDPKSHYAKGHALVEMGIPGEALASLDKALELGLDATELHLERAKLLSALSRPKEALDALERVLATNPNDAFALTMKGDTLINLKRYEDALAAYNRAIELNSGLAAVHDGRGRALVEFNSEESQEEALAAFNRATELDPSFVQAHLGRALALTCRGRDDEVLAALKEALKLGFSELDVLQKFEFLLEEDSRIDFSKLLDSYHFRDKSVTKDGG